MYAIAAPLVATAAEHCPTELVYISCDEINNLAYFVAESASTPGAFNVVGLDVLTGETHCNCRAAEVGRACWHCALVQAAWDGQAACLLAARYNAEQLAAAGNKAASMCRQYRARCGRPLPADALAVLACRCEYRKRQAVAVAQPDRAAASALVQLFNDDSAAPIPFRPGLSRAQLAAALFA